MDEKSNYIANFIDKDGEVEKWAIVPIRTKYISGGFFMGIQEGFEWISKLDLQGRELQVMIYIFSKLEFENFINMPQKQVAEALNMKKTHVSTAFKRLESYGIIHKGPKIGLSNSYRLDPSFGYKGKAKNITKLKSVLDKTKEKGFKLIKN